MDDLFCAACNESIISPHHAFYAERGSIEIRIDGERDIYPFYSDAWCDKDCFDDWYDKQVKRVKGYVGRVKING